MDTFQIVGEVSARTIDAAAQIWAEATAARDRDADVASLELARPVIAGALAESPDADLLTAVDSEQQPLGFALVVRSGTRAELRLIGVAPTAWGNGVATALVKRLTSDFRSLDNRITVELWVYDDNERAISLYQRSGWQHDGKTRTHSTSGKIERHYVLGSGVG